MRGETAKGSAGESIEASLVVMRGASSNGLFIIIAKALPLAAALA